MFLSEAKNQRECETWRTFDISFVCTKNGEDEMNSSRNVEKYHKITYRTYLVFGVLGSSCTHTAHVYNTSG